MMSKLRELAASNELEGKQYGEKKVKTMDDFRYEDSIDKSVTEKQVCNFVFFFLGSYKKIFLTIKFETKV